MSQQTTEAAAKMTGLLIPVLVGSLGLPARTGKLAWIVRLMFQPDRLPRDDYC